MNRSLTIVAAAVLIGFATFAYRGSQPALGADAPAKPVIPAGAKCKVYFRGDAAGQALQYVAAARNNPNLSGTLSAADEQWIVLSADDGRHDYHIPRAAVLMIETTKP